MDFLPLRVGHHTQANSFHNDDLQHAFTSSYFCLQLRDLKMISKVFFVCFDLPERQPVSDRNSKSFHDNHILGHKGLSVLLYAVVSDVDVS